MPANPRLQARRAAKQVGIDPGLFERLIFSGERSWKGWQHSPVGASGPSQLMPGTAAGLARKYGINPNDFYGNLLGGAYYLREQLRAFGGNRRKAVAAYNAGPGNVQKYGGVPPFRETRDYVERVLSGYVPGRAGARLPMRTDGRVPAPPRGMPDFSAEAFGRIAQGGSAVDALGFLLDAPKQWAAAHPARPLAAPGLQPRGALANVPLPAAGPGHVTVAPGANRGGEKIAPVVFSFLSRIGGNIRIGTGTNHSKMTVNGKVSDHWDGHAADIPSSGQALTALGRRALIAAGMPRAQAMQQNGGLFNLYWRGHRIQVIFNTNEGGNHYNHLHVGVR